MSALIKNISIEQGADWSQVFPIVDPIPAFDLSGAAAAMQIRTKNGATYIATLTTANGGLVIDPNARTITARLAATLTTAFVPENYVYDIKVAAVSNIKYRVYQGNAIVSPQVTLDVPTPGLAQPITTEDGLAITDEDGNKIST